MKKIVFIISMLFCPSLYAATLTANTVPYVCQGGTSPQLCNSNLTTDSNGNVGIVGAYQSESVGTIYQAQTSGFVTAYELSAGSGGNSGMGCDTDSTPTPTTLIDISTSSTSEAWVGCKMFVVKGNYWAVYQVGTGTAYAPVVNWIQVGS